MGVLYAKCFLLQVFRNTLESEIKDRYGEDKKEESHKRELEYIDFLVDFVYFPSVSTIDLDVFYYSRSYFVYLHDNIIVRKWDRKCVFSVIIVVKFVFDNRF